MNITYLSCVEINILIVGLNTICFNNIISLVSTWVLLLALVYLVLLKRTCAPGVLSEFEYNNNNNSTHGRVYYTL